MKEKEQYTVLSPKLGGGPQGLGDPNDRSLRKVEKNVLIPNLMREKTKTDKCIEEVKEFNSCCGKAGIMLVVKCRKENDNMKECMKKWFNDEDFVKECTNQYLDDRTEYRRTGISKKYRMTK